MVYKTNVSVLYVRLFYFIFSLPDTSERNAANKLAYLQPTRRYNIKYDKQKRMMNIKKKNTKFILQSIPFIF